MFNIAEKKALEEIKEMVRLRDTEEEVRKMINLPIPEESKNAVLRSMREEWLNDPEIIERKSVIANANIVSEWDKYKAYAGGLRKLIESARIYNIHVAFDEKLCSLRFLDDQSGKILVTDGCSDFKTFCNTLKLLPDNTSLEFESENGHHLTLFTTGIDDNTLQFIAIDPLDL